LNDDKSQGGEHDEPGSRETGGQAHLLEFKGLSAGGTELTLIHEGFDSEDTRNKHGQGWDGCLANLETFLA
jgi:hypothetical protein